MRKRAAGFVILWSVIVIRSTTQAQSTANLSAADRELVVLALDVIDGSTGLLMDSTAPICGGTPTGLCIRRDVLTADVIKWDFPDAEALRADFLVRNEKVASIEPLEVGLTKVPRAQIAAMFRGGRSGWRDLQRVYPGARSLTQVSAPAYSPDANRALVYVESLCDGRCGGGALLLFERRSGRWVLSRTLLSWIG